MNRAGNMVDLVAERVDDILLDRRRKTAAAADIVVVDVNLTDHKRFDSDNMAAHHSKAVDSIDW